MTWVKICGTTNLEDALISVEAGADALGFVFWENSPRNIDPKTVCKIVSELPSSVEKVGVFVREPFERVKQIVEEAGLTAAQLHFVNLADEGWATAGFRKFFVIQATGAPAGISRLDTRKKAEPAPPGLRTGLSCPKPQEVRTSCLRLKGHRFVSG